MWSEASREAAAAARSKGGRKTLYGHPYTYATKDGAKPIGQPTNKGPTTKDAGKTLASGGSKSIPAPVHPSFTKRWAGF